MRKLAPSEGSPTGLRRLTARKSSCAGLLTGPPLQTEGTTPIIHDAGTTTIR